MTDTQEQPHRDNKEQPESDSGKRSAGSSIRPGVPVPPVVLISDEGDGGVYLEGWKHGPQSFLITEDAQPLRRELGRAYGTEDLTPHSDHKDTRGDNPGDRP